MRQYLSEQQWQDVIATGTLYQSVLQWCKHSIKKDLQLIYPELKEVNYEQVAFREWFTIGRMLQLLKQKDVAVRLEQGVWIASIKKDNSILEMTDTELVTALWNLIQHS